ncbi:MAG: single-stranded-DNA-specific exonuclease RecJ [Bacillota bacterium]|nr:single-stranded-DNA-specific exonuclease RecJ [Bacillota bacterium]
MLDYVCRCGECPPPPPDIHPLLWRLLYGRGVRSPEEARRFLRPSARDLLPPEALHGVPEAAARIRLAADRGERVWVWGDYDVDGVCATAIMVSALARLGVQARHYLPSRQGEGYGLNPGGLETIAGAGCDLLITVDCGITDGALIREAEARYGFRVIVTDHHQPGGQLPERAVTPVLGDYPGGPLCGAGVAFKLAMALCPEHAPSLVDLAALATVADVVELKGENRVILHLGLRQMNEAPRPGIAALREKAGIKGMLNAGHLGFQIGPRLNAGGRVESAEAAYQVLMSPDRETAEGPAQVLEEQNRARKDIEHKILQEAEKQIEGMDLARIRALVLEGAWESGVIGLAAGRLAERYHLPVVLLARDGDRYTGSCRSIPGVDIFLCLGQVSDLLTRYGGHRQAAGLTIPRENVALFQERLEAYIRENTDPLCFVPRMEYDARAGLEELSEPLTRELAKLQPCGFGNPAPVFRVQGEVRETRRIGTEGAHLSYRVLGGGEGLRGVFFGQGRMADKLEARPCDLLVTPQINEFRGQTSVQLHTRWARPQGLRKDPLRWEEALYRFLTQALYNIVFPSMESGGREALIRDLEKDIRGTLVLCAEPGLAEELLGELEKREVRAPDLYIGSYPADRRCWNALCLLPTGELPGGYERIWCLGAPAALLVPGTEARQCGPAAEWLKDLPGLETLRTLYRALRKLSNPTGDRGALVRELRRTTGLKRGTILPGCLVLEHTGLLTHRDGSWKLPPADRVDMEDDLLYCRIVALRNWEVEQ